MEDNRTPLAEGTALELNRTKLRIIGEAGRDPDSITYIAEYDGFSQRVMIKECFPVLLTVRLHRLYRLRPLAF